MTKKILADGMKLAFQEWGAGNSSKVLALHGWLDNSNTFKFVGPYLAKLGFHVVAMDHIGHGRSSHLPLSSTYDTVRSASYVHKMVGKLGWKTFHIVGHSMGTQIGVAYAGTFPETVERQVLIEGLGPLVQPADTTTRNLRRAIEEEELFLAKTSSPKVYSFEEAVAARISSVSTYPGNQFLSREAAVALVSRYDIRAL